MNVLTKNLIALRYMVFIIPLLALSGCSLFGGNDKIDPNKKNVAFVYGYIDMDDANSGIEYAKLRKFKRQSEATYYHMVAEDGVFYHVGVDMGSYQVERFGQYPWFFNRTHYQYSFPTSGKNQTAVRIKKPGIYFLGSYKYIVHDSGSWFKADKFSLEPVKSPGEKEILKKVLERMKDDNEEYVHQIRWIEQRLKRI